MSKVSHQGGGGGYCRVAGRVVTVCEKPANRKVRPTHVEARRLTLEVAAIIPPHGEKVGAEIEPSGRLQLPPLFSW